MFRERLPKRVGYQRVKLPTFLFSRGGLNIFANMSLTGVFSTA